MSELDERQEVMQEEQDEQLDEQLDSEEFAEELDEESDEATDADSEESDEGDEEELFDDDSEDSEEGEEADEESEEPTAKTKEESSEPAVSEKSAVGESGYASIEDEIKDRVKPDFVPGSKEFFAAAEAEARAAIAKELGEFDEFDAAHIARYQYYVNESMNSRKVEFQKAIRIISDEHSSRQMTKKIDSQINAILPTPQHKEQLREALNNVSHKMYLEIESSLSKGDASKLIELAKKVAGTHGELVRNKRPVKAAKTRKSSGKKSREIYGSDILGF